MFFIERVKSIKPGDRVLEVGPGGQPHPRADVFLEKVFEDSDEAQKQRGGLDAARDHRPVHTYTGGRFPFRDGEFDYVVCAQVIEHVPAADIPEFISELTRVGRAGYLEFPTVYFDHIYNIPEHLCVLFFNGETLFYKSKQAMDFARWAPVQDFLRHSLQRKYTDMVDTLKPWMFQGFEWSTEIDVREAAGLGELVFPVGTVLPAAPAKKKTCFCARVKRKVRNLLRTSG